MGGGIVGQQQEGIVSKCSNSGEINGNDGWGIGGIVGQNSGVISECFNKGKVISLTGQGTSGIGGISGNNNSYGKVNHCSNIGEINVSDIPQNIGTIIGFNEGRIQNCYYLENTGGKIKGIGNEENNDEKTKAFETVEMIPFKLK